MEYVQRWGFEVVYMTKNIDKFGVYE
jgi:hypothetical protein